MWTPGSEDFRLLQASGLVAMTLFFGVRLVPPLQPYARRIALLAAVMYIVGGLAFIAWRMLTG